MLQEHRQNVQVGDSDARRFTTPLRRVFKRLRVSRKKTAPEGTLLGHTNVLIDCSNVPARSNLTFEHGTLIKGGRLDPPPAPRTSRLASPTAPPAPVSPLPPTASCSSNMLMDISTSQSSLRTGVDYNVPSSSPHISLVPRGNLFQSGLTPNQSVRSTHSTVSNASSGCSALAPAPPITQRVSTMNIDRLAAGVDMMDFVELDLADVEQITPTPPSRAASLQWLPSLALKRKAPNNLSMAAILGGTGPADERHRPTFMSKLVGGGWGFAGLGSTNAHRCAQPAVTKVSAEARPTANGANSKADIRSLPTITLGECSIERAVLGEGGTSSSRLSTESCRKSLANGLPPADSVFRVTGSKSGRALDHLEDEVGFASENGAPEGMLVERPKKKRRSSVDECLVRSEAPSPTPGRVTRSMAARQAEMEASTPVRVTRSTSKRLAELANTPAHRSLGGPVSRSKSSKRQRR